MRELHPFLFVQTFTLSSWNNLLRHLNFQQRYDGLFWLSHYVEVLIDLFGQTQSPFYLVQLEMRISYIFQFCKSLKFLDATLPVTAACKLTNYFLSLSLYYTILSTVANSNWQMLLTYPLSVISLKALNLSGPLTAFQLIENCFSKVPALHNKDCHPSSLWE